MLTERRAADRKRIAQLIKALGDELGAEVTLERQEARGLSLEIRCARDLFCRVELDGASMQPDVHVLPWHFRGNVRDKLHTRFGFVGGNVNPHHFGKCTAVARGTDALLRSLRMAMEMARDGSAFQEA